LAKEKVKGDKPETTTTSNKTEVNTMNDKAKNIRRTGETDAVSKAVVIALATILVVTLCAAMVVLLSDIPRLQHDLQEGSMGTMVRWIGTMLAVFIALFAALISGVFVFMTFRIDRGAKLEARNQAQEILEQYREKIDKENQKINRKLEEEYRYQVGKIQALVDKGSSYNNAISIIARQHLEEKESKFFEINDRIREVAYNSLSTKSEEDFTDMEWLASGVLKYMEEKDEDAISAFKTVKEKGKGNKTREKSRATLNMGLIYMQSHSRSTEKAVKLFDELPKEYANEDKQLDIRIDIVKALLYKGDILLRQKSELKDVIATDEEQENSY